MTVFILIETNHKVENDFLLKRRIRYIKRSISVCDVNITRQNIYKTFQLSQYAIKASTLWFHQPLQKCESLIKNVGSLKD